MGTRSGGVGCGSGHVFRVDRAYGPVWYAKYRLPDGRQVKKKIGPAWVGRGRPAGGYFSRRTAEDWLDDVLAQARGRQLTGPGPDDVTFEVAAREWLRYAEQDRGCKPSTMRGYRSSVHGRLLPAFGDILVTEITSAVLERWRAGLPVSARMKNKLLIEMHGIFKRAASVLVAVSRSDSVQSRGRVPPGRSTRYWLEQPATERGDRMNPGSAAVRPDPGPDVADRATSETRLFEQVARQACRSAHVDGAVVSAIDADGEGLLRVIAAEGDSALLLGRLFAGDRGLTGRVCELGEPIVASPGEDVDLPDSQRLPGGLRAVAAGPIWADGRVWGALTMLASAPVDAQRDEVLRDLEDLTALASAAVQTAAEVRRDTLHAGVSAFGSLLDLRDGYTSDHTAAVAELCGAIGRRMELGHADLDALDSAARLHDLGKIGVPDHILHKPSSLTGDEWDVVRCHPGWGAAALQRIPGFAAVAEAVRGHHERWDGEGYPDGVAGQEIPVASRVITVSDAYHAMTSNRPYRSALDEQEAMRRMRDGAGSQFDPGVIEALNEVRSIDAMPRDQERAPLTSSSQRADTVKAGRFVRAEPPRRGGKALAEALARATRLPALAESRDRALGLLDAAAPDPRQVIAVIESEIALTVAVLRAAARIEGAGEVTSVPDAVRQLGTAGLLAAVQEVPAIGFFQHLPGITLPAEHFRLHALATKRAAECLASTLIRADRDEILIGALLHDVGKLVLGQAYHAYPDQILAGARTPDERLDAERRHLHMDHAALGGVLLRRWELPERLITTVERHHDPDATGPAAIVRLADMLAHYTHARPVDPRAMLNAGRHLALDPSQLRVIMFDLSQPAAGAPRATHPSPLTAQEQAVLHHLATGKVYKEIGVELGIAASTVRTHCHSVYRKLDVGDRANAVLTATDNGWI